MIHQAISDYRLDRDRIVYIGDEFKDLEAAKGAGIFGVRIADDEGEYTYPSMNEAAPDIAEFLGR
jgi:histidinol phosphatase-like enzyme